MSIRARLTILLIAAIIPLIAVEIYSENRIRASREAEIGRDASRLLQLVSAEQDRLGNAVQQMLTAFSQDSAIRRGDWADCSNVAANIFNRVPGYVNIGVADLDGNVVCSNLTTQPPRAVRDSAIYAALDENREFAVGTYQVARFSGRKVLPYSMPWRDAEGRVLGVIWASIDVDWLADQYKDRFFSSDVTLLIADIKGTIVVRVPNQADWVGKPIGDQYMHMVNAAKRGVETMTGIDGQPRVIAYDPVNLEPVGLYVGIGVSPNPYFAQINTATLQKLLLMVLAVGAALCVIWFGSDAAILRPVERLLGATERWREGDTTARVALENRSTELGRLGAAFNEMAVSLEERQRTQKRAEDELARVNANLKQQVRDEVAAREKAQSALYQAQKVEAVGRLTMGIAHDFNNLLAAIAGNLELLQKRVAKEERVERWLTAAQRATDRGAKLTQQLLAFSRQQRLEAVPIDVNQVVESSRGLLHSTIGTALKINTLPGDNLWIARGDANQIELMILNLVINARDAMPSDGVITIETANVILAAPNRPEEPPAGDYVMLSVSDTGSGMAPEVLDRVFEPFFTTKGVGKGSGLGLPQVLGVAQQLGGGIAIDSVPGKGTAVKIYLPRATGAVAGDTIAAGNDLTAQRGNRLGTILVVDDDSEVRAVTVGLLKEAGHTVIEAGSGGAALERMDVEGERVDVAIVDFAMPGMNGVEVARIIRRNWRTVSILFITGFADTAILTAEATSDEILAKPFRGAELEDKIELALYRTAILRGSVAELRARTIKQI